MTVTELIELLEQYRTLNPEVDLYFTLGRHCSAPLQSGRVTLQGGANQETRWVLYLSTGEEEESCFSGFVPAGEKPPPPSS